MTAPTPPVQQERLSDELKPCPFCGSAAREYNDGAGWRYVGCSESSCGASVEAPTAEQEARYIDRWNRRAADDGTGSRKSATYSLETAWLIESKGETGRPRWWGAWNEDGLCDWTFDSLKAIRFSRKQDAEIAMGTMDWWPVLREEVAATEHQWSDHPILKPKEAEQVRSSEAASQPHSSAPTRDEMVEALREALQILAGPPEDEGDSTISHRSPVTIRCERGDLRRAWAALSSHSTGQDDGEKI